MDLATGLDDARARAPAQTAPPANRKAWPEADRSGPPPPDAPPPEGGGLPPEGGDGGAWPSGFYLGALRRWWWLPLATAGIAAGSALVVTSRETPRYVATATAVVAPTSEVEDSSELLRSLDTLERRTVVATFARIASTREVRLAAAARLGLDGSGVSGHRITASVVSSTNLIRIQAEGPDPALVAALANAATVVTEAEARRLYRIFTLEAVEAATPPTRPVHPDPQRNAGVGVVIGLFLGMLAAFAIEGLRPTLPARRGVPSPA